MNVPGLKVVAPATPADMKGLLKAAIRDDDPVLVFEDMSLWARKEPVPTDPDFLVPIGKADVKRSGSDVTIISIAGCLPKVLAAADALQKEGISAEVVDLRTLVPLDVETLLASLAKTGRLVIVDNSHRTGSVASEVSAVLSEEGFAHLRAPVRRVATPDVQIPYSAALEKGLYPTTERVVAAVKSIM
jgi:pyruvate dehydrogenase E1 component beta subunit